ncbi:MAG TPA: hypothetical protein VG944_22940 [Fimbriimonas sp.]|nr:hypothetical protein [Fimbriimonas sp.]
MKLHWSVGVLLCLSAIGALGMTRHARKTSVNGVGWFDSFDDALTQARQEHKPILLLSMFGRLDEELPCANARTLRATLFKDPGFKQLVTRDVIPAWEEVRAVPHVTIDFGDGHKLTRTVRGNAVMYLCNSDGKVVDAYPGIYTPKDFMPAIHESIDKLTHTDAKHVIDYHEQRGSMIAVTATTMSKAMVESPTLNLIGARPIPGVRTPIPPDQLDPARINFLRAASRINDMSLTPMTPDETVARITGQPMAMHEPAVLPQEIIDRDSQVNMTRTRAVIHLWLGSEKALPTPEEARETVLETILKIPYKDPYFGLRDVVLPGTPN